MVNSIKTLEEINTLRNWFKCHNDKSYDFHLLYFDLGINTCYTIDELQNLNWYELLNNDGTVVDSIMYNGYKFFINNNCKKSIVTYRLKYFSEIISDYVFEPLGRNLGKPISFEGINKMLRIATRECNLPYNITALSLRKTFAYWQIDMYKYDYKKLCQLQDILGNTKCNLKVTFEYAEYPLDNSYMYINEQLL